MLSKSDVIPEDKMNYEAARKMCTPKITELLRQIPDSLATPGI